MRSRPTVLIGCLLAATVGTALAGATAGTARQRDPAEIICPGGATQITTTTACCGPPVNSANASLECCGPNGTSSICPAQRLTLSASSDPAPAGSKIVLSGDLIGVSNTGQTIKLWQELPGATSYTQTLQATTGSSGGFSFTLNKGTVLTNRSWYVTGDGMTSPKVQENVTVGLTLRAAKRNGHGALTGKVTPAQSGAVVLQRRVAGGRWRTLGQGKLGSRSSFSWRTRYKAHGRATVRAEMPASADHLASFSPSVSAFVLRR
jgi:hypothetical protein